MSSDWAPGPAARRASFRIVLVHTVAFRQARQFVPVVLPIAAATGWDGGLRTVIVLVAAVTATSAAFAVLSWWRFSYLDTATAVVMTRGLLARAERTVPRDRIRGVEIEASPLHRLLGLVRVRIDAAAGSVQAKDEEVVVDGVTRGEGERLRAVLLVRRPTAGPANVLAPDEELVVRFDNRWLLYAPLVGSYLALPLAGVGALFRLAQELPEALRPGLPGLHLASGRDVVVALLVAVPVTLVLLAAGSVLGAAIVNWRFRLVRREGSLVTDRGLLTRRHNELEVDRIRGCTVSAGLGMRWVGAARVNALVTGLADAQRRGQLLPLGPRRQAVELAAGLVEDPGALTRHPRAALRRRLVRAAGPGVLVAGVGLLGTVLAGAWPVLLVGALLTALGVVLGLGRYAALGHRAGPRSFAVRSGWLVQEHVVLQRRAVVGWTVRQSIFARRADLATVVACVGAGDGGYAAVDMPAGAVAEFARAASGAWAGALDRRG